MADRCYTPWPDFGDLLKEKQIPLYGLESNKPLKEFDCLGFTLPTELIYTNILYTLDLAQIPIRSENRKADDPIVIAGGINAVNPHPLSIFVDAFFIGEGEEGIIAINDIFKEIKDRDERLRRLAELEFMYVPKHISPSCSGNLRLSSKGRVKAIKYNTFSTSENTHFPQLVPLLEGTHNRHTAEIMRGCTRGCRFCQAGMFYRPVREKDPNIIISQLLEDISKSGWNEAGLLSLSSSDYSHLKELLNTLIPLLKNTGTSLALPSLRIDNIDTNLVEMINHLKKSGITLAPEAGTQRLRDIINKNLSEEDILNAVRFSFEAGAKLIKLYFMVGLPFETDEDVDGIIELVEKIISIVGKKIRINISISPFVPKPMTPFQWCGMESEEEVLSRALKIKHALIKYKFLKISYHRVELSFLEAVLCRGDVDTGRVIEQAYKNGAIFDSWREYFDYNIWKQAAETVGFDWYKPIRGFELEDILPWDNINVGVSKDFLIREYKKAEKCVLTEDCRNGACSGCGACKAYYPVVAISDCPVGDMSLCPDNVEARLNKVPNTTEEETNRYLYRIYYSKLHDLKFLSHLDFLRLVHRLLMMSGLPIVFTQGFSPHPKTAFCPPLSSGIEGENEFFDIWMSEFCEDDFVLYSLKSVWIKDLSFHRAILVHANKLGEPKNQLTYTPVSDFDVESVVVVFPSDLSLNENKFNHRDTEKLHRGHREGISIHAFLSSDDPYITKTKKDKEKIINLKDIILNIEWKDDKLYVLKKIQGASIYDILDKIFGIKRVEAGYYRILRTELSTKLTPNASRTK